LQREVSEMRNALRALVEMQSEQRDRMEAEASTVGGVRATRAPLRLSPDVRPLAIQAITHLLAVTTAIHAAQLVDAYMPGQALEELPATRWEPQGVLSEPQPSIEVGVLGGSAPSRGRVMVDTGAGMSLISSAVARAHGLQVRPYSGTFSVASGQHAKLTGEVDLDI
jgi:hypothetical protein